MPTVKSKGDEALLATNLVAGAQKHLSNMAQLMFDGGTTTPAQVETSLKALATLRTDVDAARTVLKAKLADEKAQGPTLRAEMLAFVVFVRAMFGNSPDVLADFGLLPKKARTPMTPVQKAAAAAKAKATRAARGTTGKRKKLAIKGDVTGILVTPVTANPPPAPTAPSAPGTPPTGGSK